MKKFKNLFLLILILLTIASCQPYDPEGEADAYATRSGADQQALNNEQQRQFNADEHTFEMKFKEIMLSIQMQLAQSWVFAKKLMIVAIGFGGSFAIGMVLLSMAIGLAVASIGTGVAKARAENFKATLIYADPKTGLYPLKLIQVHGSRWAAYLPNAGSVLMLDEKNEPDRQMIAAMGVTQTSAVLANAAKDSKSADAIAMIEAPVVYAKDDAIEIGAEIRQRLPKARVGGEMEIIQPEGRK